MKTIYDVIKNILRTEKGTEMLPENKYLFHVMREANKIEIKQAVEEIYHVKAIKVNTIKRHGKMKKIRYKVGKTPDWKLAVVTLKEGDRIDIATT